jgi:RimJ/RimL family protein N-acetyltransferase
MEIRTERLLLRPARTSDASALHAVFSDPAAMRYWSTLPHTHLRQTRAWLADMIASPWNGVCDFIVERDGQAIGKAGCWRPPEIGYILHPRYWGQGLAREAVAAAIDAVFAAFDIPAITADVDPRNAASLKLLAAFGFVETGRASGTIQVGDELCDSVYLALARPTSASPSRVSAQAPAGPPAR